VAVLVALEFRSWDEPLEHLRDCTVSAVCVCCLALLVMQEPNALIKVLFSKKLRAD
jgi:hypothetical protein